MRDPAIKVGGMAWLQYVRPYLDHAFAVGGGAEDAAPGGPAGGPAAGSAAAGRNGADDGTSAGVQCEFVPAAPSTSLRPYVRCYLGFRTSGPPLACYGVPFSGIPVVIAFDHYWLMASDEKRPMTRYTSFVRGLSLAPGVSQHDGHAHGLLIDLTPLGAALLFRVPGAELSDQIVPLDALLGREAGLLVTRLLAEETWPRRFALLDTWLRARFAAAPPLSPGVVWAWRRLAASGGQVPIATLLEELGCSRRHLAQSFGDTVGMTPKAYARVIRFERAIAHLSRGDEELGAIALECGYYDQAHFNRDVRAFAGLPPAALLPGIPRSDRHQVTFFQDML